MDPRTTEAATNKPDGQLGSYVRRVRHTESPADIDPTGQIGSQRHRADLGSIGGSQSLEDYSQHTADGLAYLPRGYR